MNWTDLPLLIHQVLAKISLQIHQFQTSKQRITCYTCNVYKPVSVHFMQIYMYLKDKESKKKTKTNFLIYIHVTAADKNCQNQGAFYCNNITRQYLKIITDSTKTPYLCTLDRRDDQNSSLWKLTPFCLTIYMKIKVKITEC